MARKDVAPACEVCPRLDVVLLHSRARVDEEQLRHASTQPPLKGPLAVPSPVSVQDLSIQLHERSYYFHAFYLDC